MGNRQVGVLHGLTKLVAAEAAGLTDGQLLRRFAATRDDGAFTALIQRHGPLVYGVCRNVLRQEQDAEDAFQATFLVLAKRAGAIREGLALGGWLYRVAYRVATKSRLAADRRRRREVRVPVSEEDRPVGDLAWRELQGMLDEELNRLPEKYRAPFVLCVLTGKSKPEAAAALGWKEGTVSSRLAQAREKLRARLFRRGVTLSAVLSGLAISDRGAATAVPAALVEATRRSAVAFALGKVVAEAPAALARAVLRGMSFARLRYMGLVAAVAGLAATVTVAARPSRQDPQDPPASPPVPALAAGSPGPKADPDGPPAGGRMKVGGRVLAGGKPAANAQVTVVVGEAGLFRGADGPRFMNLTKIGEGVTKADGTFTLSVPQTTYRNRYLTAVAKAPGFAFGNYLHRGDLTAGEYDVSIMLVRGQPLRCRLVDANGQPARSATVHVVGLMEGNAALQILQYEPPVPVPNWPGPLVTDGDGYFTVPEVAPGTKVMCQTRDQRYADQWVIFKAGDDGKAEPAEFKLEPVRVLTGRVVAQDTGEPLAGVQVVADSFARTSNFRGVSEATTDAAGRYSLKAFPGDQVSLSVYPPDGAPFPAVQQQNNPWPAGAARHTIDFSLPRGALLRGTVQDEGTGRPVAGAEVMYDWAGELKALPGLRNAHVRVRSVATAADGSFTLGVPAGRGHVTVKARETEFVHQEIASSQLTSRKGGHRYFAHAIQPVKPAAGADGPPVSIRLRRGVTVRGRVVDALGAPVDAARLYAIHFLPVGTEVKGQHSVAVRDGRFELPGCEPGKKVKVWVFDPDHGQGSVAELTADPQSNPEIRLAPAVSAKFRLLDHLGLPVDRADVNLMLVLREGADVNESFETGEPAEITIPAQYVNKFDYWSARPRQGNFTLPLLIPGATYAVRARNGGRWSEPTTFTAPATGTLDLGQIALERPK